MELRIGHVKSKIKNKKKVDNMILKDKKSSNYETYSCELTLIMEIKKD